METKPIETQVGFIQGRNAFHLDIVKQVFSPLQLIFEGQLSSELCSNLITKKRFISYNLMFETPFYYCCCELEKYKPEKYLSSSFDSVINSSLLSQLGFGNDFSHYVLSTYDFVYEIVAKKYELKIVTE